MRCDIQLIAAPGHDADRNPMRERLLGDTHAAVTDRDRSMREQFAVRKEAFDDRAAAGREVRRIDTG
jgi:hypothetical protein